MNRRCAPSIFVALALGALATSIHLGCKFVESGADALADATKGSAVSSGLRAVARTAESFKDFSPSQEYFIGRSVGAQILARYPVHTDEALTRYVNLVGQVVASAPEADRTVNGYHFVVLEGDELQAVSTPGGFVFLTVGTIRRAKDEDELAAVLAHEVAHVTLKHGIKSMKAATRQQAAAYALEAGAAVGASAAKGKSNQAFAEKLGAFTNVVGDLTSTALVTGYSRSTEIEADKLGAKILQSSRYARSALASYLKGIAAESGGGGWTATHPKPADRINELGDLATGDSPGRPVRKQRFLKLIGG